MRHLVTIQRIKSLSPIEGADRIELAHILGWQCVVNKGQFHEGDLCVYFEIDSFLPVRPEYEFLRKSSYKNSELLGEGFRLKTMKFKGNISQGLALPLSEVGIIRKDNGDFHDDARDYIFKTANDEIEMVDLIHPTMYQNLTLEGLDITDLCGVKEWEIPEQASSGGTIIGEAGKYIHITDETRIQSQEGLFERFSGKPYYITTKLDGSSHSVCIQDDEFHVFGHNYEYKNDGKSSFYNWIQDHHIEDLMREYMKINSLSKMVVQGEYCGAGIQNNRLRLKEPNWFFFTIDEDGQRVGLDELLEFKSFCADCGNAIDMVPVEEIGSDLVKEYGSVEALLERSAKDPSKIYCGGQPEGIVIRPMVPEYCDLVKGMLSMKVINNKYLLKG